MDKICHFDDVYLSDDDPLIYQCKVKMEDLDLMYYFFVLKDLMRWRSIYIYIYCGIPGDS